MKISTIGELTVLSKANQDICNTLMDLNLGRRQVVWALDDSYDVQVSEKLVRTFRDNMAIKFDEIVEAFALGDEEKSDEDELLAKLDDLTPLFEDGTGAVTIKRGKARSSRTIVIMPDVQAPLHDQELTDKFVSFIRDFQPDELAQTGDFTDSTEPGRWVRGKKKEYAGDLRQGFHIAMDILDDIRCVFDGRIRIVRSNHDDRLELYIENFAPALAAFGEHELSFESLMHFDDYEVEFVRDGVIELVKDQWIMAHGDEGSLSPQAGKTAFGLAKNKFGVNVVCGHTHRAGITSESYGYNGRITHSLTGFEVGHFMDLRQADYLKKKGGTANWQQAFGILETLHGKTFVHPVMVNDGYFSFEGVLY